MSRIPMPLMIATHDRLSQLGKCLGVPLPRSESLVWTVHEPDTHRDAQQHHGGSSTRITSRDRDDDHARAGHANAAAPWFGSYCQSLLQGLEAAETP